MIISSCYFGNNHVDVRFKCITQVPEIPQWPFKQTNQHTTDQIQWVWTSHLILIRTQIRSNQVFNDLKETDSVNWTWSMQPPLNIHPFISQHR